MNYIEVEGVVALSHNKQCHPREGGDLLDQAPHSQNEVPAFAGMTLPVEPFSSLASNTATAAPLHHQHETRPTKKLILTKKLRTIP